MHGPTRFAGITCVLMAATFAQAQRAASNSVFEPVASYEALGGLMATAAAPGPTAGSERIYASYLYADNTLDVIAIDPANGAVEVFHNPVPGEYGARNIAVGPDGDVYFGTLPHAHFLHLDRKVHRLVDLGRPSANEEYIWDVAFGSDGKLYGVTYPGCRLVRYDPASGALADLGRMDPTEKYGRWIVGGRDGFLYIGVGTAKANLAVYDTHTGAMREVLPPDAQIVGTAKPYLGVDGKVYATAGDREFALTGFNVRELAKGSAPEAASADVLSDGRIVELSESGGLMTIRDPRTNHPVSLKVDYAGEKLQLFRIAFGPDKVLYGSAILPAHFVRIDIAKHAVTGIGELGGGELYSLLAHNGRVLMGAYAGLAPLMSYDPVKPFRPSATGNPSFTDFTGADEHWRPQAMIAGSDGTVYIGGTAGYGQLEGPLVAWDGVAAKATVYSDLIHNQSVISLALWRDKIVGGTTIEGGGGSHPTETDARVFLWDPVTHAKLWDVVPVAGASMITDLIAAPSGLVYGIAINHGTHTLFALDPQRRTIVAMSTLPFRSVVYNGVVTTKSGAMLGLAEEGIFRIDDAAHRARLIAPSPVPITGGIALESDSLYFVSNSEVYRYRGVDHAAK